MDQEGLMGNAEGPFEGEDGALVTNSLSVYRGLSLKKVLEAGIEGRRVQGIERVSIETWFQSARGHALDEKARRKDME